MHFSSSVNRPPYEAQAGYLQVTSGCSTHNKCAFCIFYQDSRFKESPIEEIKADLAELRSHGYQYRRLFLQGADPFVLSYDQLMTIADLIHEYLPSVESIGGYARINNIEDKTIAQLREMKATGYSNPYFGIESGDDVILKRMNKGYTSDLITEQCSVCRQFSEWIGWQLLWSKKCAGFSKNTQWSAAIDDLCIVINSNAGLSSISPGTRGIISGSI
jgi:radical SAM superfamily enzyme YgiQ (UPF0313 family)